MNHQLVTYDDIARRTGVPRETLYVWNQRGKMPPADYLFGRSPAWTETTIGPWIDAVNE